MGYRVPDDFSVVGMDDNEISSEIEPPLTTVRVKMKLIGEIGLKNLNDLINGNYNGEKNVTVDNELIERKSCKQII